MYRTSMTKLHAFVDFYRQLKSIDISQWEVDAKTSFQEFIESRQQR